MSNVSELRKFDAEIGWLVFTEQPDIDFRLVIPAVFHPGYGKAQELLHYTTDREAAQRIIDRFREFGAEVVFENSGNARFPVMCRLKVGQFEDWVDAEAASTSEPMALCMAIFEAAHRVVEMHGRKYVSLDWAQKPAPPEA